MGKKKQPQVLGLRTCAKDGSSHKGKFHWPLEPGAVVKAPDWDHKPACGGGLHFLPWGEGDGSLMDWSSDAVAMVIGPIGPVVDIDGAKSKAGQARVVAVFQNIPEAAQYIADHGGQGRGIAGMVVSKGYRGQATAGYRGQATAGDSGQATAGDGGQATAGYRGQATAGDGGQATAGDRGQATAGYRGQATAGDRGQATAGYRGQATAGDGGLIIVSRWDNLAARRRVSVGYIGETMDAAGNVLVPETYYRLDGNGGFVPTEPF